LAATSANLSGEPAPVDAAGAHVQLGPFVDFILDGGRCPVAQESTIVELTGSEPRLLRAGAVPVDAIEAALGRRLER
jgi:L-threonylcarbamoyladenylate synthase